MKKIIFILFLFFSFLYSSMSYLAIVIDSKNLNDYVKLNKLIKKIETREKLKSKYLILEVFDIRSGNVIYSILKERGKQLRNGKIISAIKKLPKNYSSEKAKLDKVVYNIRINTLFPIINEAKIYFLESLLTDNKYISFDQRIGFPNKTCLDKKVPLIDNKPFRKDLNAQIFVWNRENRFASQYIYYFYNLFKQFNLNLVEYREDDGIITSDDLSITPIRLVNVTLPDDSVCKLSDGLVSLTSMAKDKIDISEPEHGIVILKGYNKNRANSIIEIKFNDKIYTVRADENGNYKIKFDLVPGKSNLIYVKMMNNKYEKVYSKNYILNIEDKVSCKIQGNHIIVQGTNKYRRIGSNVKIIYNNDEIIPALVDKYHKFTASIPIQTKINQVSIIQLDGSKYDCPILHANITAQDSIYHNVKNMTAEICVVNPDRHSNKITYKYENEKNKPVTKEATRKGNKLCFKVPLKYDKVHNFEIKQPDGRWINHQIVINKLPTNFIRIRLTFNCDSDVDLHVLEPKAKNGTEREVNFRKRRNFGELDVDSRKASEGPENYVLDLTNAPKGRYYYWVEWYTRAEKEFNKYYNKSCYGKLEIVENGQVRIKPISFLPVPYTSNKQQQIKYSTYPANRKDFYFDVK